MSIDKLEIIIEQCCDVYQTDRDSIMPRSRVEAKKSIQYIGYKFFGISQAELGRFFKTSQPTINSNVKYIESSIGLYLETKAKVNECRERVEKRLRQQIWLDEHNVNRDSWLNILEDWSCIVCSETHPDKDKDFFVWLVENFKFPKRLE